MTPAHRPRTDRSAEEPLDCSADGPVGPPEGRHENAPTDGLPAEDEDVTRSSFLRGGVLALGAGSIGAVGLAASFAAPPADARPRDRERPARGGSTGVDPNPDYQRPRITRLATLTGPERTTRFRMDATDLGAPAVTPDGRILMIFGDTFEEPKVGGGWWRSPVGLYADPDRPLEKGVEWTSAVGGRTAEQLVEYEHDSDPVSTILPGDVLTIGDTMYLWMMVNHGFGTVGSTEIWTSTDSGESWERTAEMFPGDHLEGRCQQCTWALHPTDGHVYLLTTGFQRDKEAILQRVPAESILDPEAYETWGTTGEGEERTGSWGAEPTAAVDGQVGEMCLRIVEDSWVLTWFNSGLYRVDVLISDSPVGLTESPFGETLLWGCNWDQEDDERVAQLYGPYVLPGSTLDDLHLACSQWRTGPDWPYHVEQFRVEGLGTGMQSLA